MSQVRKRFKDHNWAIENSDGSGVSFEAAQLTVLMDLRDELKRLNSLLHCPNFVTMPQVLREIRANTTRKKPKRKIATKVTP